MANFQETLQKPAFYYKAIVFILYLVADIFVRAGTFRWYCLSTETTEEFDRCVNFAPVGYHTHPLIGITIECYLIVTLIFMIIYFVDSTDHHFELLFLIIGAILSLVAGALLLVYVIAITGTWGMFAVSGLLIGGGVVMVIDFIREKKGGGSGNAE